MSKPKYNKNPKAMIINNTIYWNMDKQPSYRDSKGPYPLDENNNSTVPQIYEIDKKTLRNFLSIPEPGESLQDMRPDVAAEFICLDSERDYYKQHGEAYLKPKDIKCGTNQYAWFKCSNKDCGYIWKARIDSRNKRGHGCPYCSKQHISFPEKYMYYCLKQIDPNLQENYKILNSQSLEFDMYDPASRLAIEFNGAYHNKDGTDDKKLQLAINNNINLIRVWQYRGGKKLDLTDKNNYIIPDNSSINNVPYLDIIINDICEQYGADYQKINRKSASNQAFLRTNKTPSAGESLLDQYPDICRDWDYNKNGVIRPELLKPASSIKVWWTCIYCGKSWQTRVDGRTAPNTLQRAGCQACNRKIGQGLMREMPYIPGK